MISTEDSIIAVYQYDEWGGCHNLINIEVMAGWFDGIYLCNGSSSMWHRECLCLIGMLDRIDVHGSALLKAMPLSIALSLSVSLSFCLSSTHSLSLSLSLTYRHSNCVGHTACESVSVDSCLNPPSSRIYWNSYWLPLQDKCKSYSLIFAIYQDAAAHFLQGNIS